MDMLTFPNGDCLLDVEEIITLDWMTPQKFTFCHDF